MKYKVIVMVPTEIIVEAESHDEAYTRTRQQIQEIKHLHKVEEDCYIISSEKVEG